MDRAPGLSHEMPSARTLDADQVRDDAASRRPRTDATLEDLFEQYDRVGSPIPVNFRSLVNWIGGPDRVTHLIHPYPAKLLTQIPVFFLSNSVLSEPGDIVLDPFCGSGTVPLEAVLAHRRAVGADANPLARLITGVKVRPIPTERLRRALQRLLSRIGSKCKSPLPSVVNIEYWFYPHVIDKLRRLRDAINATRDRVVRDFFLVCFSNCVRRVSLADPRLSVPVRLRKDQYPPGHWLRDRTNAHLCALRRKDVIGEFAEIAHNNIKRMEGLVNSGASQAHPVCVGTDARSLKLDPGTGEAAEVKIADETVSLVITSPPYIGAQKYIRASSLSIGWLDLQDERSLRDIEDDNIGREHYSLRSVAQKQRVGLVQADKVIDSLHAQNPLRAHIAATYLREMRDALREISRVLRRRGHLVLVTGNNLICGQEFQTSFYLSELARQSGLKMKLCLVDSIRSRGLMTRRNLTAGMIDAEWVSVFQKEDA